MSIRQPAVAGMFYPAVDGMLQEQIEASFFAPGGPGQLPVVNPDGPRNIVGLVCPHAGYIYSGSVAASGYYHLAEDGLPRVAVILGPNHRSYYPAAALTDDEAWRTPLGDAGIDASVTGRIAQTSPYAEVRPSAHESEHSIEVQLPFLQYLAGQIKAHVSVVPILIGAPVSQSPLDFALDLGGAIAEAVNGLDAVIIASTDFTHYETGEAALHKDSRAISSILALNEEGLLGVVEACDISMCGVLPTAVAIAACKKLGAISAQKLSYQNSGDVTGDYSQVVGYAAIKIHK